MVVVVAAGCSARIGAMQVLGGSVIYAAHNNLADFMINTKQTRLYPAPSLVTTVRCNDEYIFVGCQNGEYLIYKYDTPNLALTSTGKLPNLVAYSCVCHDAFIVGCIDGAVYYVNMDTVQSLFTITAPKRITSIGFVSMYSLLIVAVSDLTLCIYHIQPDTDNKVSVKHMLTLSDHHVNWINWIDSLEDRFLTCGQDKNCRVWSIKPKSDNSTNTTIITELVTANRTITLDNQQYTIDTEALLMGHEDMVLSGKFLNRHSIITSSADRTVMKWAEAEEAWQSVMQVGDVTGIGAAGNGDLYDVDMLNDGSILAHNTNGTIVVWQEPALQPVVLVSGHFGEVTDLAFDRVHGDYLLTCSSDRTTRAWYLPSDTAGVVELARPQIHGYDVKSIDFIDDHQFVSAADEKVLRIFNMTDAFASTLCAVGGCSRDPQHLVNGAVMQPALGLSNKSASSPLKASTTHTIPTESELSHSTLWPETDKLYGHGDELQCVACSADGKWMASASRATLAGDSSIRLWSTVSHQTTHVLKPHNLTVVRLQFSPNGRYLLSCSRDRKLALSDVEAGVCVVLQEEAHERIIWDGAWISDNLLVTGSRDKTVKLWQFQQPSFVELLDTVLFEDAVTALCTAGSRVFVGCESGHVYCVDDIHTPNRRLLYQANGRINRLSHANNKLALASADHAVVIIPL